MKFTQKIKSIIVRCIILSMILPQLVTVFAHAENSGTVLNVGDYSTQLSITPYANALGIMIDASEITEAFNFVY